LPELGKHFRADVSSHLYRRMLGPGEQRFPVPQYKQRFLCPVLGKASLKVKHQVIDWLQQSYGNIPRNVGFPHGQQDVPNTVEGATGPVE